MCLTTQIYRVGPQPGWEGWGRGQGSGELYVPNAPNNRKEPQAREPSKCLNGWSYGKGLPKRPSDRQLQ